MAEVLDDDDIEQQLPEGWERDGDEIVRTYEFDDYLQGISFVSDIGEVAEEEFHHPEIAVGNKKVEVRLTTHDSGGITNLDMRLADLFNDEY